jgi:hypothetical protein
MKSYAMRVRNLLNHADVKDRIPANELAIYLKKYGGSHVKDISSRESQRDFNYISRKLGAA